MTALLNFSLAKQGLQSIRYASIIFVALAGVVSLPQDAGAQVVATSEHSPRGALLRSLAVPGWGQLYNRHYYKIPIVYAGLGSLVYIVSQTNSEYKLYRRAFQFKAWDEITMEGEVNPVAEFEADYLRLLQREGLTEISSSTLEPVRDRLRRNRDFAVLGVGVVYALSTLDAYVSAHLLEFDVSDDLSVVIMPKGRGVNVNLYFGR